MSYKDLLIFVDETEASDKCIDAAIRFANLSDAHLTGLCLSVEYPAPGYMEISIPVEVQLQVKRDLEERTEATKARFAKAVEAQGRSSDCRIESCMQRDMADVIGLHGRYADLLVMQQPDPAAETPRGGRHLIERVVLGSGRPTLIVPYIGAGKTIGERVTVAWDAGREAARAVSDAMPILTKAEKVTVLVINKGKARAGHGEEPGADIAQHLARHGVKCEVRRSTFPDLEIGDAILSQISDLDSDLLVMGAYGHQRLRELILGGVTQTIFEHMTVPILVSH